MTLDFSRRSTQPELMDTEPVSFAEFRACLVDLARVNQLSGAYRPTLAFFDRLLPTLRRLGRPLEVVDVGSGYGDMLRRIDAWAARHRVAVSLTGVDLNPWSRQAAAEATPSTQPITWVTADAFAYRPPRGIDVVISSLFTHHLSDPAVIQFVTWMEKTARLGWFVNDLHRHPLPYHVFRRVAKLARFHRFVQHDGPVSIARAFGVADWRRILDDAGLSPKAAEIAWRMPFRLTVGRWRE
ncbi:MAG: methyltransferase domain-containing protein [Proteobacteria bacterium]|nr:methyltransferase domain-containing protein [Pseudomonadota bacterium]